MLEISILVKNINSESSNLHKFYFLNGSKYILDFTEL